MGRARLLAFAAAGLALALAACGRDDRVPETDTSKGAGIIDSAPGAALAAVAATLSDENVFALLDTAYAALAQTDSIGAAKATDPKVKAFAAAMRTSAATNRSGIAATFDRLQVRRILPDRDVIKDHAQAMDELRTKAGKEFDDAYVRRAADVRRSLVEELDDALKVDTRTAGVKTYLQQLRDALSGELRQAEALGR